MSGTRRKQKEPTIVYGDETSAPKADAPKIEPPPETRKRDSRTPMLSKLLSIGDLFREENSMRQAISIYFDLAEKHSGTPEAYDALERLLDIAAQYEDAGEIRQALSLYERLL